MKNRAMSETFFFNGTWAGNDDVDGDGLPDTGTSTALDYNSAAPNRHNNGANYLFKDGHVEYVTMKDWENNVDSIWPPW